MKAATLIAPPAHAQPASRPPRHVVPSRERTGAQSLSSEVSPAAPTAAPRPPAMPGHTLAKLRVRVAAEDAPRARALGALAYTVRDIVHMPPGLDRPRTTKGRELLAHESIHARQWHNGRAAPAMSWGRDALEGEARALAPRVARGEAVAVHGVHRGDAALGHPIFISTHGTQAYLRMAEQFYIRWGYGTPTRVGSIEEMLERLAGDRSPLGRVTLVSHAVPSNINIGFLRGGPGFVLQSDWSMDTLEELPTLAQHVTGRDFLTDVFRALRADRAAAGMLDTLGLRTAGDDPLALEYVWWLLDGWFIRGQPARQRAKRVQRDAIAAAADARAQTYRDAIAVGMAAAGGGAFSFPAFEGHFTRVLAGYSPGSVRLPVAAGLVGARGNQQVDRILGATARGTPTFFDRIEAVRGRLGADSHIEVQGCRVGRQPDYLAAMSGFFNGALVTAPDWFQLFGHVGYRQVPADDDRTMRRLWRDRTVRRALMHWAPIVTGNPLPETPGWEDLAAFLRAGHPLIVGRRLLLTRPMGEQALIAFLARQGYRITGEDELREEFVEGRQLRDAVSFALIDWLQENRNGRGGIAFRPDPAYRDHIRSSR